MADPPLATNNASVESNNTRADMPPPADLQLLALVQETRQPRSKVQLLAVLVALDLSLFIAALDQTIMSTAVPTIAAELQSASGYAWIGGAYLLASAAAGPIWAKLSDIWGRKPILLAAVFQFFFSSMICALAVDMKMLITGRALQGVAAGGLMQLVVITISDLFSMRFVWLGRMEYLCFTDSRIEAGVCIWACSR